MPQLALQHVCPAGHVVFPHATPAVLPPLEEGGAGAEDAAGAGVDGVEAGGGAEAVGDASVFSTGALDLHATSAPTARPRRTMPYVLRFMTPFPITPASRHDGPYFPR
jgi:hypothetical protein